MDSDQVTSDQENSDQVTSDQVISNDKKLIPAPTVEEVVESEPTDSDTIVKMEELTTSDISVSDLNLAEPTPNTSTIKQLYELFDTVIEYGYQVRKNDLNGLDEWKKIKPEFSADNKCEWSIVRLIGDRKVYELGDIYDYVHDKLGMKGGDEDQNDENVDQNDWEKFHFFLQLIRIPRNNDKNCSLLRLMQIAYNLGQLKADYKDSVYTDEVKEFYDLNKLEKLDSYVNPEKSNFGTKEYLTDLIETVNKTVKNTLRKIEEEKTDQDGGANDKYYHKYLKYKAKYLALR